MKKMIYLLLSSFLMVGVVQAKTLKQQPLDKVQMMLSADKWVNTTTAKVEVAINATLTQSSLVQMRRQILKNLNIIAKGEWHIVQFNRRQGSSGLENLYVNATVRVAQSTLSEVYNLAKKVSKPGVQYKIMNIDFSPSSSDVKRVEKLVRQELYRKINNEVAELNGIYTKQHYSVHHIVFSDKAQSNRIFEKMQRSSRANKMYAAMSSPNVAVPVSNKVTMNAIVSIASNRGIDK